MRRRTVNNRYRLTKKLGEGGIGEVWLCEDALYNRYLALKTMASDMDAAKGIEFLQYEFEALRKLSHPNIGSVYDFGVIEKEGKCFFTQEYIEGNNLFDATKDIEEKVLYDLVVQIARALQYIHFHGIVHYDIKPSNILVTGVGGKRKTPQVKLIDFGLSEFRGDKRLSPTRGTLQYMAPEVRAGRKADHTSDLYSLGMLLFHITTRKAPSEIAPATRGVRDMDAYDIPDALKTIIRRLTQRSPSKRYRSAQDVIREINRLTLFDFDLETEDTKKSYVIGCKFVGRDKELKEIKTVLENRLLDEGKASKVTLILVTGEAGIGKTRLMEEIRTYCQLHGVRSLAGTCSEDKMTPYKPFIEILEELTTLTGPRHKLVKKYAQELVKLVPGIEEFYKVKPSPELSPQGEKLRLIDNISHFIMEASREYPLHIHLSDIHWADDVTVELLKYLMRNLNLEKERNQDKFKLLISASFRDEEIKGTDLEKVTTNLAKQEYARRVRLKRFNKRDILKLVTSILGGIIGRDVIAQKLYKETQGNPFFIIETMKVLVDEGVISYHEGGWRIDVEGLGRHKIPETVEDIFKKRLHKLDRESNTLLQAISAFEDKAKLSILKKIKHKPMKLFESLSNLEREEMLRPKREENDISYGFNHTIMRDVVYGEIREKEKYALHREIGELLEKHGPELRDENPEILAYHFLRSEDKTKATRYALKAGEKAKELFSYRKAREFYTHALGGMEEKEKIIDTKLRLMMIETTLGNLNIALKHSKEILRKGATKTQRVRVFGNMGNIYGGKGNYDKAMEYYREGLEVSKDVEDNKSIADFFNNMGVLCWHKGDYDKAMEYYEKSLKILEDIGDKERMGRCFNNIGLIYSESGDLDKALAYYKKSLKIAENSGNKVRMTFPLNNVGTMYCWKNNYHEAMKYHKKCLKIREQIGDKLGIGFSYRGVGETYLGKEDSENALKYLKGASHIFQELGSKKELSSIYLDLTECCIKQGKLQEARKYCKEALRTSQWVKQTVMAYKFLGVISSKEEKPREAEKYFRDALDTAKGLDENRKAEIYHEYGKFLLEIKEPGKSREYLEKAASIYQKMVEKGYGSKELDKARKLLGKVIMKPKKKPKKEKVSILKGDQTTILEMIDRIISSPLDLEKLLGLVMTIIVEKARAERGFLMLKDEKGNLTFRSARNIDREEVTSPEFKVSYSIIKEVYQKGKPVLVTSAIEDERFKDQKSVIGLELKSILSVPIRLNENVIGIIYLDNRHVAKRFTNRDLNLLSEFSKRIAGPIHNSIILKKKDEEIKRLKKTLKTRYRYENIIGQSKPMQELFKVLDRIIDTLYPVVIEGETGTGKELVTNAIHYNGPRKDKPLIAVNCAAFPETLLEAELFGYKKGAFTGADKDKVGLFEEADGGTLFLDEIGNMGMNMQQKLLRAIEEKEIRPVGAEENKKVDVRIICASNRDLEELVQEDEFRDDLYYRLNVIRIKLPPLRERKEDIPLLVNHFLSEISESSGEEKKIIDEEAIRLLIEYDWPGNVRELENEIKKLVTLGDNAIRKKALRREIVYGGTAVSGEAEPSSWKGKTLREVEVEMIIDSLKRTNGNKSKAARLLNIPRTSLNNKIRKYNISLTNMVK